MDVTLKLTVLLSAFLHCNGVSVHEQLAHIAQKLQEYEGNTNNGRRFSTHEGSVIIGAPSYPSHLPESEPILPGHTLLRPAIGMLKSAVKFPHRDLENGAGVYGNINNLGIRYDSRNERLMYSGFRRTPTSYILMVPVSDSESDLINPESDSIIPESEESSSNEALHQLRQLIKNRNISKYKKIKGFPNGLPNLYRPFGSRNKIKEMKKKLPSEYQYSTELEEIPHEERIKKGPAQFYYPTGQNQRPYWKNIKKGSAQYDNPTGQKHRPHQERIKKGPAQFYYPTGQKQRPYEKRIKKGPVLYYPRGPKERPHEERIKKGPPQFFNPSWPIDRPHEERIKKGPAQFFSPSWPIDRPHEERIKKGPAQFYNPNDKYYFSYRPLHLLGSKNRLTGRSRENIERTLKSRLIDSNNMKLKTLLFTKKLLKKLLNSSKKRRQQNIIVIQENPRNGSNNEHQGKDVSEKPNKHAWFYNGKNSFNHIKIKADAPEHEDYLPKDSMDANDVRTWWYYHQGDFIPFDDLNE